MSDNSPATDVSAAATTLVNSLLALTPDIVGVSPDARRSLVATFSNFVQRLGHLAGILPNFTWTDGQQPLQDELHDLIYRASVLTEAIRPKSAKTPAELGKVTVEALNQVHALGRLAIAHQAAPFWDELVAASQTIGGQAARQEFSSVLRQLAAHAGLLGPAPAEPRAVADPELVVIHPLRVKLLSLANATASPSATSKLINTLADLAVEAIRSQPVVAAKTLD